MYALLPLKGLIESTFNIVLNPLGILCLASQEMEAKPIMIFLTTITLVVGKMIWWSQAYEYT